MKLRWYLRGLGLGMIVTGILFIFSNSGNVMSEEEIIKRAKELGMVESKLLVELESTTEAEKENTEVIEIETEAEETKVKEAEAEETKVKEAEAEETEVKETEVTENEKEAQEIEDKESEIKEKLESEVHES